MREGVPGERRVHSANDEFKARWEECLAWSTLVAVAAHAAVFALSPSWHTWRVLTEPPLELLQLGRTSGLEAGSSRGDPPSAAVPAAENSALEDRLEGVEVEIATQSGLLRRRLLGEGAPVPMITEPEPVSANDPSPATDEDPAALGGAASTTDHPNSLGSGELDRERLSSVRPELAFIPPSVWVVLRNSPQVVSFMRSVYSRGLDPEASGTVIVALWVDEKGSVEWAEVAESSGRADLDEIVLALFNEVVDFRPARDQGVPVPTTALFSITFPWF
ncbi:MAG: TonB family protein [Gemmatimonadetes bacterium]|nr:TonB family protein [Gemmatimonadota bacterium]